MILCCTLAAAGLGLSLMQFILDKVHRLKIGWNERRLDEAVFYQLCERFAIEVVEMPLRTAGFYYRVLGRDFIALDSKLTGPKRHIVMFHELGHFLFHTAAAGPSANFHGVGRETQMEHEADIFALCAVIPLSVLEKSSIQELVDEGLPAEMASQRFEVFRRHGV